MDECLKSILLLNSVGAGNAVSWKRFVKSRQPSALWREPYSFVKEIGISETAHARLMQNFASAWAEREEEACLNKGVKLIPCTEKNYPHYLNDLENPPLLLYWHGAAESIGSRAISVVGTRRASAYGKKTAALVGAKCAELNTQLISGGALGIDGFAHAGCCRGGGVTLAILGTGVDQCYPSSHRELFEEIRGKGALLSEYPLGTKGEPWRFPRRNRIVAALAGKTLVVEAPKKSGAMITARQALELGREVWAVPGRIDEAAAEGVNALIFDGAYPLIDIEKLFCMSDAQTSLFDNSQTLEKPLKIRENLSDEETLVVDRLTLNGERTVDNISVEVKMSAAEVMKIIAVLSAKGLIYSSGPGRFSAKI